MGKTCVDYLHRICPLNLEEKKHQSAYRALCTLQIQTLTLKQVHPKVTQTSQHYWRLACFSLTWQTSHWLYFIGCSQWSTSEPQAYSELGFLSLECTASIIQKLTSTMVPMYRKLTSVNVSLWHHCTCSLTMQTVDHLYHCRLFWSWDQTVLTTGRASCKGREHEKDLIWKDNIEFLYWEHELSCSVLLFWFACERPSE